MSNLKGQVPEKPKVRWKINSNKTQAQKKEGPGIRGGGREDEAQKKKNGRSTKYFE